VVPGGGPSLRGERRWITSHRRDVPRAVAPYLVDANALRQRFRQAFLAGLRRLHQRGSLKLDDEWCHLRNASAFHDWLQPLEQVDWVTYIQPPPSRDASPEHVLKYLARYLTGGPISDRRLISDVHGDVTFWARTGSTPGGDRADREPCTLPGPEFVQRWSLHILPKGFVKTRRFGGYSNRRCQQFVRAYQNQCPVSIVTISSPLPVPVIEPSESDASEPRCASCGERMQCIAARTRDSWSIVMTSHHRPRWYLDGS
jgi:hypothetical protein